MDIHMISLQTFDYLWGPYDRVCSLYSKAFPIGNATLIGITWCNALLKI